MIRIFVFSSLLLLSSLLCALSPGADASAIIKRSEESNKLKSEISRWEMIVDQGGGRLYHRTFSWRIQTNENMEDFTLMRFLSPDEIRGVGLLTIEHKGRADDQWFYHPATRRIKRIAEGDRRNRFMGTEFLYEDMQSYHREEHRYVFKGYDVVDGERCYRIEEFPKNTYLGQTSYGKKMIWIGVKSYHARRILFYDKELQPLKELTFINVHSVKKGIYREDGLKMVNKADGRSTTMTVIERTIDPDIGDETFSLRFLRRRLAPGG